MKGATGIGFAFGFEYEISIHAPVKGATTSRQRPTVFQNISIHAPVKGATTDDRLDYYHHTISIHAPVKGATDSHGASQLPMRDFNPRSREGSDMVPQCQW